MLLMMTVATSMQRRSVRISACTDSPAFLKPWLCKTAEPPWIGSVCRPEANGVTSKVVSREQFSVAVAPPEQDYSGPVVALRYFSAAHHVAPHCSSQVLMSQCCVQVYVRYPRSTDDEYVAAPRFGNSMSNKSSPLDVLPTSLLKSCADVFAPVVARIANLSFTSGKNALNL